jgi:lycopene beta-cyclase
VVWLEYASLDSAGLDDALQQGFASRPDCLLGCGETATAITAQTVSLQSGRVLHGKLVIDGRGLSALPTAAGFQVFLGQEFECARPHGLARPVLIDARANDQTSGFHFRYWLPLASHRLLLEDTRYIDQPLLDAAAARRRIATALATHGLTGRMVREESGVLPIPWQHRIAPYHGGILYAGLAGGWFHPATGYSLPLAARLAEHLIDCRTLPPASAGIAALQRRLRPAIRFACHLNWMLFRATPPAARWRLLARFYRYPTPLIARFYALRPTLRDRCSLWFARWPSGISPRRLLEAWL